MNARARETTGCLRSWLVFSHSRASDTLQSDLNDAERQCFIVQLNTGVIFFHFRSRIWKNTIASSWPSAETLLKVHLLCVVCLRGTHT